MMTCIEIWFPLESVARMRLQFVPCGSTDFKYETSTVMSARRSAVSWFELVLNAA